jgi:hypothetical protein
LKQKKTHFAYLQQKKKKEKPKRKIMNHNVLFLEKKGQQVINYNFIGINIKQAF